MNIKIKDLIHIKYKIHKKYISKNDNEYSTTRTSLISDEHRLTFHSRMLSNLS